MVVGIDEVGRGCWAGPLVVGAVLLGGTEISGLTDSKKLTAVQREQYAYQIRQHATAIGIGWISPKLIDVHGLSWALRTASQIAAAQIPEPYKEIIIDGTVKFIDDPRATTLKKADLLVPSVSAASIIAKVARDRYMYKMDAVFRDYGFRSHVGYGTAKHRQALQDFGATPIHRMSFAPLDSYKTAAEPVAGKVGSTSGRQAEMLAADFLRTKGYHVVAQNWRTRWCEIDIIAERDGVLSFVEVKYRKGTSSGGGLEAVTKTKLRQMEKAAEMWCHLNNAANMQRQLSVIALEKEPMQVMHWLPTVA